MEFNVNWVAIVIAALANMILGAVWYTPKVFGTEWMRLSGMTDEKAKTGAGKAMTWMVICSLLTAVVLAHALEFVRAASGGAALSFVNGAMAGFWLWVGFTFANMFSSYQFNQHPTKLAVIDLGYPLVSYILMGGILAVWVN